MFRNLYQHNHPTQLYHLGTGAVRCQLKLPAPPLDAFIYYYWWLNIECDYVNLDVVPDAATDLVVSPDIDGFSAVYVPQAEKFTLPLEGPIRYAGVSFKTATIEESLGMDINALSALDPGPSTTQALGVAALVEQIQLADNLGAASERFQTFFLTRINPAEHNHALMRHMVSCLESESIKEIARQCGMSERQFRRSTNQLTGLSPKQILRISRLQAYLHSMINQDALDDHFYDDAHRIRELKRLTGLTPGQFKKLAEKYNP